jgi:hypothetical protein
MSRKWSFSHQISDSKFVCTHITPVQLIALDLNTIIFGEVRAARCVVFFSVTPCYPLFGPNILRIAFLSEARPLQFLYNLTADRSKGKRFSHMGTGAVKLWARGSVVGWGTMLQAGRSRVRFSMRSLPFSIDLILHYGPGVDTASNRNEYQESSGE